jgi:hypothetical protein
MTLVLKKYLIPVPNGLGSELEPIRHHILIRIRKKKIFGSGNFFKKKIKYYGTIRLQRLYGMTGYRV